MPSLRSASSGDVPARSNAQGTSRCMIAASARLVQISSDCTATLRSGFGGTTEKPIRYDRVPLEDTSGAGGSRGACGQPATARAIQALSAQVRTDVIMIEYALQARIPAHRRMSSHGLFACGRATSDVSWRCCSDWIFVELIPHEARETRRPSPKTWQPVRPEEATKLTDARLQLHHAAQFAAAAGISFLQLPPKA